MTRHEDLAQSYLSVVQKYIQTFANETNSSIRIKMVQVMEKNIIEFNKLSEEILEDNQPIKYLFQDIYIKQRIEKINKRLYYTDLGFVETSLMYGKWCDFLTQSVDELNSY
jgi:hypothetical protein